MNARGGRRAERRAGGAAARRTPVLRAATLAVVAAGAVAAGALAAERALRDVAEPVPVLTVDSGRPLFDVRGLRHGDRAFRCVALANEGPGEAFVAVLGRREGGDLGRSLRLAVTRGCDGGTVLFSGRLEDFERAGDASPWPAGARGTYGLAVEVVGSDADVQGRRAVHEFPFASERAGAGPAPAAGGARSEQPPRAVQAACRAIAFARPRRRVLVKRRRVDARVTAKLIVRIHGAPAAQRLVLVTRLRAGRKVLAGRDWRRVSYRVGAGAGVTSTRRPFRVRIAPGALRPGRNVVRVTVAPRRGRAVRARYALNVAAATGGTSCAIG